MKTVRKLTHPKNTIAPAVLLAVCLAIPSHTKAAVDFLFNFTDAPGIGFNAAGQTGSDRRASLNMAADYIESFFGNYTASILFDVNGSVTSDSTLASASSFENSPFPGNGFGSRGDVMIKILGGADPSPGTADGQVNWNFEDFAWEPFSNFQPGEFDLISTGIHELTHALGFSATIGANGSSGWGETLGDPSAWSPYARFVADSTGSIIDGGTFSLDITRWNVAKVGKNGGTGTGGLFFIGANAEAANGGNPVSLYSPSTFSPGSSVSHLDTDFFTGANQNLMNHTGAPEGQIDIRNYSAIELGILKDIGYTNIVPEPSTAILGAMGVLGLCFRRTRKGRNG